MEKICKKHGQSEFTLNSQNYYVCKKCRSEASSRSRENKTNLVKPKTNKNSKSKEYRNAKTLEFRYNHYEKYLYYQIKSSAKKRGLEFNLTFDDIVIPKYCKYLNIELIKNVGKGHNDNAPSVDRIDNNKGYIKGNIQIISRIANKMKNDVSIETLLTFSKNIIKLHST